MEGSSRALPAVVAQQHSPCSMRSPTRPTAAPALPAPHLSTSELCPVSVWPYPAAQTFACAAGMLLAALAPPSRPPPDSWGRRAVGLEAGRASTMMPMSFDGWDR